MKTITAERAQWIIERIYPNPGTALWDFSFTGVLKEADRPLYHKELNQMLGNKPKYFKKDYNDILKLKSYFDKWVPLRVRHPADIKTFQFKDPAYPTINTIFDITWNELIVYFPGEHSSQSISMADAKKLAQEILDY